MLVDDNKNCRKESNLIGSSSIDKNVEDLIDFYGSQPRIDVVTYHILS